MANCQDCDAVVVWLKRGDGSWAPPVEPVLDFANGEYVMASAEGAIQPIPQVYKRHRCLTPEERKAKAREREEERQRLIAIDRARRAEAQRIAQEVEEYEAEQERLRRERETEELRERVFERYTTKTFKPKRLLAIECRGCGAEKGEPCRSESYGQPERANWWIGSAHQWRYTDEPLWGEDYAGRWPPPTNAAGYRRMQRWLADNFTVFDPDEYRERDWLTSREVSQLRVWFRENGDIFEEEKSDRPYDPSAVL